MDIETATSLFISAFTTDIQHVAGKTDVVADCLLRAIAGAVHLGLDYTHMTANHASDQGIQQLWTAANGLQLSEVTLVMVASRSSATSGQARPLVPTSWRRQVFDAVHVPMVSGSQVCVQWTEERCPSLGRLLCGLPVF